MTWRKSGTTFSSTSSGLHLRNIPSCSRKLLWTPKPIKSSSFSRSCARRSTCPPCMWRPRLLYLFALRDARRALCLTLARCLIPSYVLNSAGRNITEYLMTYAARAPVAEYVAPTPAVTLPQSSTRHLLLWSSTSLRPVACAAPVTTLTAPATVVTQQAARSPIASATILSTTHCALPNCGAVPFRRMETLIMFFFLLMTTDGAVSSAFLFLTVVTQTVATCPMASATMLLTTFEIPQLQIIAKIVKFHASPIVQGTQTSTCAS